MGEIMTPLSTIKSERHVFDTFWFKENQRVLLWLLNAPVIKYWFRWIMNIPASDCPVKDNIFEIQPNNYKVYLGLFLTKDGLRHKIKVDFKTKNRYANRLYRALYPLWVALHIWDLIADKASPKLSFGFSTLTQYPGSIGSRNPVDEFVARIGVDETFSTIRAGAGTDVNPDSDSTRFAQIEAKATSNHYGRIDRYIFCFDTSSLSSSAIISAATLSIYGTDKESGLSGTAINIYSSNPAATNNYSAADFNTLGTTAFATAISNASYSTSGYNAFTLNASGIAGISLAGITKMGTREASFDATGTDPTWVSNARSLFNARGEHFDGNTSGPKLVITYTTPAAYTQTLTETLHDTSMLSKQTSVALIETIHGVISLAKGSSRSFAETLHDADTLIKQAIKSFLETMTNMLTFSTQSILYRTLDESIADHDGLNKKTGKILSETNHFTDALVREMTKVLSEAINYAATFYKQSLKNLTETVANLDALLLAPMKVLAESISHAGSLAKETAKAFSESVVNIADLSILSNFYRIMAETLANIDFVALQKTMFKALTESLHSIDAMTRLAKKGFAEVIHGADVLQKQTLITLLEATIYIASLTRQEVKALKETMHSIDSLIKSTAIMLKDTAHYADAITRKTLKNFTEIMHGAASLSRRELKVIKEMVHFSDIIVAKIFFKILAETLHTADSISKKLTRNLKETISIIDRMVGRILESLNKMTLKLATKLNNILKLKI